MNTKEKIKSIVEKIMSESEEGQILVNPIDHAKAVDSEAVTDEPEVIDHATGKVVKISDRTVSLSESKLREIVRNMLLKSF